MTVTISEPLSLPCGVTLKNRLCKGAMTEGVADEHNRATDRHAMLYKRWADGGAGLLLTGNVQVDRRYLERAGNVVIEGVQSNEQLAGLAGFAEAGTSNGAHVWMQISHGGRQTPKNISEEPVGPSDIKLALPGGRFGKPRALTHDEILDVIQRFAHVASVAKQTGFTGVQVHAAHGYLISEFLSPKVNLRDDQWGGSINNRARLLVEVIRATRTKVGTDFPIAVKLNSADFQKGGFSFEDCLAVVELLNAEGVDLLEISGGTYEQPRLLGMEGMEPVFEQKVQTSTRAREAYFFNYAVAVRKVAKMPVMVTGGFRSRAAMNEALSGGEVDMIGLGRPLCWDPDFPNKIMEGSVEKAEPVEKTLRLGPGIFGPNSPIKFIKMINGFGTQSWYYEQIYRMADGKDPDLKMTMRQTFGRYDKIENDKAKAMVRG